MRRENNLSLRLARPVTRPTLGARPMATRSIVVCSGVLPVAHRIHVIGSVIIHIAGCAISPFTSTLELVLTVDREAVGYNVKHGIRMQRHHGFEITVNNKPCKMQWLSSCVRLVCNNIDTTTSSVTLSFPHGTGFPVSIPLAPAFDLHTHRAFQAAGTILLGEASSHIKSLRHLKPGWSDAGFFRPYLVFARDASACIQIHRAVDDVRCETRNSFVPLKTEGSDGRFINASLHPYFEQRVNQQVALVYARAANAPYLALTEIDDFAPSADGMRALLDGMEKRPAIHRLKDYEAPRILIKRNGKDPLLPPSRWGTRLFVDSLGAVQPKGLCPSNHSSWKELTNNASDLQHVRPSWRPIVVPNMTWDVSADGFIPMAFANDGQPTGGRDEMEASSDYPSGVWCPCVYNGLEEYQAAKREGFKCA